MNTFLNEMANAWPSEIVARSDINQFTGGLLSSGTLANYDSKGSGPRKRIRVGKKVGYPKAVLIEWLEQRCTIEGSAMGEGGRDES